MAAVPPKVIEASFVYEKDTKTKTRYSEYEPTWVMGTMYINSYVLQDTFGIKPRKIKVTIEVEEM